MKRLLSRLSASALTLIMFLNCAIPAMAETTQVSPTASSNIGDQNYIGNWATPVYSHLYLNDPGEMTRVEYLYGSQNIILETFNRDCALTSSKTISAELSLFGGFYAGEEYNFLIFGQSNPDEDNNLEVIRVVKYSKDWERLGAASLRGANTTVPFAAGSLRCAEYNGMLYIRTSHQMYKSSDGLNHQANLTMSVRQSDMSVTDSYHIVMNVGYGYVSHSFNQFILVDSDKNLIALDHGDAYPRSAVLIKYNKKAGNDTFTGSTNYVSVLPFSGAIGANATKATLGGLAESSGFYITVGSSIVQDSDYTTRNTRNIYLSVTDKSAFSSVGTSIKWLTDYEEGGIYSASTPHLVRISNNRFLVMWSRLEGRISGDSGILCYTFIDGEGRQIGETYTAAAALSDCAPILVDDEIVWYVTAAAAPTFYMINAETGTLTSVRTEPYTVAFHSNGGTAIPNQRVAVGDLLTKPSDPTKDGHIFAGWHTDNSLTAEWNFDNAVTGDMTLYAKWTPLYTVAFNSNGGTAVDSQTDIITGSVLTKPSDPTKVGHIFAGWYTDSSLTAEWDFDDAVTADMTLYAKWTPLYTVTFNSNGGTAVDSQSVTAGAVVTKPNDPTRAGYTFSGWYKDSACTNAWSFATDTVTGNTTIYAGWTRVPWRDTIAGVKLPFTDVDNGWYTDYVKYVYSNGLMTGTATTTFELKTQLTRAQMAQILYNIEGRPAVSGTTPFTDISGQWYTDAMIWAYQNGIINGTSATTAEPNTTANRQTVATMLYRYASEYKHYDVSKLADLSGYKDASSIASWAYTGMQWANAAGMITGTDSVTLSPNTTALREQMAKIITEFVEYYK